VLRFDKTIHSPGIASNFTARPRGDLDPLREAGAAFCHRCPDGQCSIGKARLGFLTLIQLFFTLILE
jgi:hypothetical protein